MMITTLEKLDYYISHGLPIFPIYSINADGKCSCGNPSCDDLGKHPRISGGFYGATNDAKQIRKWIARWPLSNWAMRTGDKSQGGAGIVVLDIDNKNGGVTTWNFLREENPGLIETVTVRTGNYGQHLYFNYPDGLSISSGQSVLGSGIDIRANGGYILIPPSTTTGLYEFENDPYETPISDLPNWMLTLLERREKSRSYTSIPKIVEQGQRHQFLVSIAVKLRRDGLDPVVIEATLKNLRNEQFVTGDHPVTDEEIANIVRWANNLELDFAFTDLGNAERFCRDHSKNVRYCFAWECWLVWDGKRWVKDNTAELQRLAHETVRGIYSKAASVKDENRRRDIAAHALRSESRSRIDNMLHLSKPYLEVKPEELDQQPMLLNVRNGIIDLTTGTLLPHEKKYFLTKYIDVDYIPDAECLEWNRFIDLITGGDKELAHFLQKAVGYSLSGNTDEHCIFFLYGSGLNGKTTFLETIRRLLSSYTTRIEIGAIMESHKNGNAANPYVANMAGARFVLGSEIAEDRKLNEALIKDLTGSDAISARLLFGNPFTFIPQHKLWLYGNYKPKVDGTDNGFWRRMRVVPFIVTIGDEIRKPMSEVTVIFDAEMSGILNWAIQGCQYWQNEGLDMASAVENATAEYRTEQDLLQQFLDEQCSQGPNLQVDKEKLLDAWRNWCRNAGEDHAMRRTKNWLTRQMTSRGFTHGGDGKRFLLGVGLR
jgi:putative DNA primase/helicase